MTNSRSKVVEIIAKELEVEQEAISEDRTLEDLGVTSPNLLEIAMAIEEEFAIKISDKTLGGFRDVGDIITYVKDRESA